MYKLIIMFVSLLVIVNILYAPPRMVVGEMFTNTGCGPCVSANNTLNQVAYDCQRYLAVIRYHTWWPSSYDPFYRANISENTARTQYYGTNYVPRFYVDGIIDGGSSHPNWRALIDTRSLIDSPLRIVVSARYGPGGNPARAIAKIYNDGTSSITARLHFVLTETGIYWPAPNGSTMHNQTMLDMIPDATGELVTILAGDSITIERDFTIRDTTWLNPPTNTAFHLTRRDSCEMVVFIKEPIAREIYQGGKAPLTLLGIEESKSSTLTRLRRIKVIPNPFTQATRIHLSSSIPSTSPIRIYDVSGNLIKTITNNQQLKTNNYLIWDGKDRTGKQVKSGAYFIEYFNTRIKVLKI